MLRVLEDGAARADLDDLAQVHHRHAMADPLDNRHVVRDEQERHAQLALQVQQQVDDLRLDRHVQRRHGFVGDHHLGIERQGPRDADALALAAGELVRIAVDHLGHEAALVHQPAHPFLRLGAAGDAVDQQRLHDGVADRHARVERGERILEDELDVPAQRLHGAAAQRADVLAVEFDRAAAALDQLQQRAAGGGLAAAGLAHQRQRLAWIQVEADLLHGVHALLHAAEDAAGDVEGGGQVAHLQHRAVLAAHGGRRRHGGLGGRARARRVLDLEQRERGRLVGAVHGAQARHGRQQGAGVGMLRPREDFVGTALLDLVAAVHDQHPVGHFGHHAHVVGDEDHAHVHFFLQLTDQLQDLGLDGDVQRRGGLVGDQQLRLAGQRHGDHDALAHAAGQLVRIAVEDGAGLGDAHPFEHAQRLGARRGRVQPLVQLQRFGDLVAGREARVERGHRLLEDHGHVGAAHALQRAVGRVDQVQHLAVAPAQLHAAVDDAAAAVLHQAHQRQRGDRLARAGFADDRQRLAPIDVERHVAHRFDDAVRSLEAHGQVVDLDDAFGIHSCHDDYLS
ncbi:Uncharacterised protein [Achromobacter sp. 2789STDY5608615]|nr:Uncharacterised protein [Achromobacter sp. 2789STDY5608615]